MNKEKQLLQMLEKNNSIQFILEHTKWLNIPNWYLGAGGIAQTVWNIKHNLNPENGIKDYDLVYYDKNNISYEAEDIFVQKGKEIFKDIPIPVDIINEARVYLWYKKKFGCKTDQDQYKSVEEAINTWPTTATAIGIRKNETGEFKIYAPFNLDDLLNMVVRPNKAKITKKVYQDKIDRWIKIWPNLQVIPWD